MVQKPIGYNELEIGSQMQRGGPKKWWEQDNEQAQSCVG